MDNSEEKFFEELSKIDSVEKPEYEVDFAKAGSATLREKSVSKITGEDLGGPEGQLTIDVYQTPEEIVVESAIAGVRAEDIDISVTNDSVTVKGSRHRENKVRDEDYLYQECYWGRFSRSIILPQEVDAERASVKFKNGILTIHLPKLNRQRSKKLKVKLE